MSSEGPVGPCGITSNRGKLTCCVRQCGVARSRFFKNHTLCAQFNFSKTVCVDCCWSARPSTEMAPAASP
ncbi:hypothetical protein C0Q70_10535 [Pomacea canaliculata]|uniref:Uncharacterized protein n=1 Tax=Pomacea canaliculata TaxID=400727 RepID=A0A2T7P3G9_POMCA|nr:hypothetical protein C0Q70_10535 [Pomacea canaliculata]